MISKIASKLKLHFPPNIFFFFFEPAKKCCMLYCYNVFNEQIHIESIVGIEHSFELMMNIFEVAKRTGHSAIYRVKNVLRTKN